MARDGQLETQRRVLGSEHPSHAEHSGSKLSSRLADQWVSMRVAADLSRQVLAARSSVCSVPITPAHADHHERT